MSIDYRVLKKQKIKYQVPLPRVDKILSQMGGEKVFSALGLKTEYNQIKKRK